MGEENEIQSRRMMILYYLLFDAIQFMFRKMLNNASLNKKWDERKKMHTLKIAF